MIKIFLLSLIFLVTEIYILESYLASVSKHSIWKIPFKNNSQRRAFKVINNILNSDKKSIFVFGGSASREFYPSDRDIASDMPYPFYNCATSNQTSYDSLKMQNLLKESNIIIYGLHPKSLQDPAFGKQQIIDGVYFSGQYYKYPVKIYTEGVKNYLEDNNISTIHKIFPVTNAYIYLLKEYIKNHSLADMNSFKLNHTVPKQYNYLKEPMPYSKLEKKLTLWQNKSKIVGKEHMLLNFKLIEKMILLSQKHHTQFILWELPFSPIIEKYLHDDLKLYYQQIALLKKRYPNMIFISNKVLKPTKQNLFYDSIHLRPIGRTYYYQDTIDILNKVLK